MCFIKLFRPEPVPFALEWDQWDQWDARYRSLHPIKFLVYRTGPQTLSRLGHRIVAVRWWFQHRFNPRHRYHMLRVADKPGYADIDTRMMEACFRLLVTFVERCGPENIDWDENHDRAGAWMEIRSLYQWWTVDRPARKNRRYVASPIEELTSEDYRMENLFEEAAQKEDQSNLRRLIDVRPYLWT